MISRLSVERFGPTSALSSRPKPQPSRSRSRFFPTGTNTEASRNPSLERTEVARDIATEYSTRQTTSSRATIFFALFYDDFRRKFVPKRNVQKLFVFVARIYIIVYFAIALFTSVYELALYSSTLSVLEIVALALDPTIVALSAVAAFIYASHLKKVSLEDEDNELFIKKEETPDKEDDNVFKDLGF